MPEAPFEPIRRLEIATCQVGLDGDVRLGSRRLTSREYAVLRLHTAGGLIGEALGYTRGNPVAEALRRMAPAILGGDALAREALLGEVRRQHRSAPGAVVRAVSLVDIALWDVAAKRAGLPLWRLLGGARPKVPLLGVGGYATDGRDDLRRLAAAGYPIVKLHFETSAATEEVTRLARLREELPDDVGLAVDAGMGWSTVPDALVACRRLDALGLTFVEDPFIPAEARLTGELRDRIATPVAAGEDAVGIGDVRALVDAVDVLRVDATSLGGITTTLRAAALGAARGRAVMTHAFPELHAQIAGGVESIGLVEVLPYDGGANPARALLASTQPIDGGTLVLSEEPGNGIVLDWDRVVAHSLQIHTKDTEDD